ncbi:amidohydrolase family protein [uncultured Jatrophihabitans sp.]|uniref:amidohydrolase family protein n=1 Tax=uncultured Jatrophihabitans sp. TaxID=1610747 RepID=UPI0035CA5C67
MTEGVVPLDPPAIDLHAHYLPERYLASARAHGQHQPDGMPALPDWNLPDAIDMMDRTGIAAAALSISSPGVSFLDSARARADLARAVNQDGADAVARFPDRLAVLATLPLPSVPDTLDEIDYSFDVLGVDGVTLHTHYDGVYLGDQRLEPVMAALSARAALVTIHPVSPCDWPGVTFGRPRPMLEFLLDTTRAVVNLALSGALDRYPAIRWVVPHAGAALPVLADRVNLFAPWFAAPGAPEVDLVAALGRLHYDLAGVPLPRALPALLALVGTDRIVYGSDYPFTSAPLAARLARELQESPVLDNPARCAAFRENAMRLLTRFGAPPAV